MPKRGLILAAPGSSHGKTTVTFALLAALRAQGITVTPFKIGPDYIDPGFHQKAAGQPCANLDPWAMRAQTRLSLLHTTEDFALIEAVMGLFDGAADGTGSSADLAASLGLPVVLVIDARGMAQSVAALIAGFAQYRSDLKIAGVIFNRVRSKRHAEIITQASPLPVIACLPEASEISLPSRHLGLVQAVDQPDVDALLRNACAWALDAFDLKLLLAQAAPIVSTTTLPPLDFPIVGQHIAIAHDAAFSFVYPHLLQTWQAQATVSFFSPLANQGPDLKADAVFLPGGYPELHAETLANNHGFHQQMQAAVNRGAWVYGECGGFMVLGEHLIDGQGKTHPMLGLLPLTTSFADPKRHLGYRYIQTQTNTPFGPKGVMFRGHEFHYTQAIEMGRAEVPFLVATSQKPHDVKPAGLQKGRVLGSYLHLIDKA